MVKEDHTFCRVSLKVARDNAISKIPKLSAWCTMGDWWEVRTSKGIVWTGKAHCAFDAKAQCIVDLYNSI